MDDRELDNRLRELQLGQITIMEMINNKGKDNKKVIIKEKEEE